MADDICRAIRRTPSWSALWQARSSRYDFADAKLPVLRRMFAKRLKVYHALGYTLTDIQ
jgi:hypothetical protein